MATEVIGGLTNLSEIISRSNLKNIQAAHLEDTQKQAQNPNTASFDALFQSALSMLNETNNYTNAAEQAELDYAMGLTTNTHDLKVAQQKATISLQYTVAVRNGILDAYREIMQLQF